MKKRSSLILTMVFVLSIFLLPGDLMAFNQKNNLKSEGQVVAVIDTGVNISYEPLKDYIWTNAGEIPGNGVDDDGNGYVDDINGWNFCDNSNSIYDSSKLKEEKHGTMVASIIAENKSKVIPLKVFSNGNAKTEDIVEAIKYAEKMGANVVNISWGSKTDSKLLRNVIENSNMKFVCAAGNDGVNLDKNPIYPACFNFTNVITVGTKDSNYGSAVDLIKEIASGETSVAAAMVSGSNMINSIENKSIDNKIVKTLKQENKDDEACYQLYASSWENISLQGDVFTYIKGGTTTAAANGKIYVFGGIDLMNNTIIDTVFEYNPSTNSWTNKNIMPKKMAYCKAVTLNNKIYLIGGQTSISNPSILDNKIYEYNPVSDSWTVKYSIPVIRYEYGLAAANNKLYIIGGKDAGTTVYNSVFEYDPTAGTWLSKAGMPTARKDMAVTVYNGKIYAFGGDGCPTIVEVYNPASNSWQTLPTLQYLYTVRDYEAVTCGNCIYLIGGYDSSDDKLTSVQPYNPLTNELGIFGPDMNDGRASAEVCELNGMIYVIDNGMCGIKYDAMPPTAQSVTMSSDCATNEYFYVKAANVTDNYSGVNTVKFHITSPYQNWWEDSLFLTHTNNDWQYLVMAQTEDGIHRVDVHGYDNYSNEQIMGTVNVMVNRSITPTGITGSSTSNSITVSWGAASGAAGYDIEVDGVVISRGTSRTYTHSNLAPSSSHTYRVRSNRTGSVSAWSNYITYSTLIAVPAVPTNVNLNIKSTSVTVSWTPVAGAASYDVYVDGSVKNVITNTYSHTGLSANTVHKYKVRAKNAAGASVYSTLQTIYTLLAVPSSFTSSQSSNSVTITWSAVSSATSYDIEIDGSIINNGTALTYTHTGLAAGSQHSYRVRGKSTSNSGEWTTLVTKIMAPSAPANITTALNNTSIVLNWGAVLGAASYDVEKDGSTSYSNITTTSFTHTGLTPATAHTYRVRAKNASGDSAWSSTVTATTILSVPTNLKLTNRSTSAISVSWDAVTGATGYDVSFSGVVADTDANTSYTKQNLSPGTCCVIKVRAKCAYGTGEWCTPITAYTKLDVPSGLSASATNSSITVNWNPVSGANGYEIIIDGGSAISLGSATSYLHTGLLSSSTHTYKVRAMTASNSSDWTNPISKKTLPAAPTNLTASKTNTTITLAWNMVNGATGYKVCTSSGEIITGITTTTYMLTGLVANTSYTYKVLAVNETGDGDYCAPLTVITLPNPPGIPTNVTATSTATSITIRWTEVQGADSYDLMLGSETIDSISGTAFTKNDLTPNTSYTYSVRAKNAGGASAWSQAGTKTTLAAVPGVPSITNAESTQTEITIEWTPVEGAVSYEVWADVYIIDVGNTISFIHSGLEPQTMHEYKVRARNAGGKTSWSIPVQVYTKKERPLTPANLSAEAGLTTINLSWDNVEEADTYEIMIDNSTIVITSDNTYSHTGLEPESEHAYKVMAVNSEEVCSEWSEEIKVSTLTNNSGIPTNLRGVPGETSITLEWDDIQNALYYEIELDGNEIETVSDSVYAHKGLEENTQYQYRVRTIKTDETTSDWTEVIKVTTSQSQAGVPKNISADATEDSISLCWDAVEDADEYEVEIDQDSTVNTVENTYKHSGLQPDSHHTYRIRSKNSGGYSAWSQAINKTTLSDTDKIPSNIRAESTSTTISVQWDSVDGIDSYEIQIDGNVIKTIIETIYKHENLLPNTTHSYRVRTVTNGVKNPWSTAIIKATESDDSGVPQNLLSASTENSITITWDEVIGAECYEIELDGGKIETISENVYQHVNLSANTMHTYRVRTIKDGEKSEWSCELSASTLSGNAGIPSNIKVETLEKSINISWDAVAGAISYDVEKDSNVVNVGNVLTFQHTGLQPGTSHIYRVRAVTEDGPKEWSMQIKKSTILKTPVGLKAVPSNTTIRVVWEQVEGAAEYEIEVDGAGIETVTSAVYVNRGLGINTLHVYRVRAKTSSFISEWTQAISVSTNDNAYTVSCAENKEFNLIINANDIKDFNQHRFVIQYNPAEIEVLDLCGTTQAIDLENGEIIDSDINIKEFAPGYIEFSAIKPIEQGKSWNGFINDIRYKCIKTSGTTEIRYEMITQ